MVSVTFKMRKSVTSKRFSISKQQKVYKPIALNFLLDDQEDALLVDEFDHPASGIFFFWAVIIMVMLKVVSYI